MTSKTETGFKVQSTYRKTGKTTTLDPNFLDRRAAQAFLNRLEAKFGGWYAYEVLDLQGKAVLAAQLAPGATLDPQVVPQGLPAASSASEGKF